MLTVLFLALYSTVFADQIQCPKWTNDLAPFNVQIQSLAVDCRSECKFDEDCLVQQDICGRRFTIHRKYESEIKEELNSLKPGECPKKISLPVNEKAVCVKNKCQFRAESCSLAAENLKKYLEQNFSQRCSQDRECSFLLRPNEKCVEYYPINAVNKDSINENELSYLKNKILNSCMQGKAKFCPSKKVSQCFMGQCIQAETQIPYISYVNFEGQKYEPNFKSRTVPLLLPDVNDLKCLKKSDCLTAVGICGQYAVALGKDAVARFQAAVQKKGASIACPLAPKLKLPKPDCIENYCVFAEK